MATRTSPARERIIATACELFYAHGIRGVGVDRVIAESGVAKATLYSHFRTKRDLVVAYLQAADVYWQERLRAAAAAAGPEPRDQIIGVFGAIEAACREDGFRGCPFLNTAAESGPGSPIQEAAAAHKRAVRAWIRDLARQAGAPEPDATARAITLLLDGAMSAAAMEGDPDVAIAAAATARVIVETALGNRADPAVPGGPGPLAARSRRPRPAGRP